MRVLIELDASRHMRYYNTAHSRSISDTHNIDIIIVASMHIIVSISRAVSRQLAVDDVAAPLLKLDISLAFLGKMLICASPLGIAD